MYRIFPVEDDDKISTILSDFLQKYGYKVVTAQDYSRVFTPVFRRRHPRRVRVKSVGECFSGDERMVLRISRSGGLLAGAACLFLVKPSRLFAADGEFLKKQNVYRFDRIVRACSSHIYWKYFEVFKWRKGCGNLRSLSLLEDLRSVP